MTTALHVIGAGGHAKVILALALATHTEIAGLYDDDASLGAQILGHPVIGKIRDLPDTEETWAVIAIGANNVRQRVAQTFQYVQWMTLIHPNTWLAADVHVGPGSVVMAGAVIQPGTRIGRHAIVNTSASVDHDCHIGDYVHIAPGVHLAGNVSLLEGAFTGVGTSCVPGVNVGQWSVVGAGSVLIRSLPANVTAVGTPAKVIKEHQVGWQKR